MYLKIFFVLLVILLLYYVVMIILDIRMQKAQEALSNEKVSETDIDISDEASTFQPTFISRDEQMPLSSVIEDEPAQGTDEPIDDSAESINIKESYPEPQMTDGLIVEELLEEINSLAEYGSSDLGAIIHAWEIVD